MATASGLARCPTRLRGRDLPGLKAGDVITAFDGHTILSPNELIGAVNATKAGDQVTIAYDRSRNAKTGM